MHGSGLAQESPARPKSVFVLLCQLGAVAYCHVTPTKLLLLLLQTFLCKITIWALHTLRWTKCHTLHLFLTGIIMLSSRALYQNPRLKWTPEDSSIECQTYKRLSGQPLNSLTVTPAALQLFSLTGGGFHLHRVVHCGSPSTTLLSVN